MSVILNVYAFLGQRSKAVSFLRNIIFSVDSFIFICFAVVGHLINVKADRFFLGDSHPSCTEMCN